MQAHHLLAIVVAASVLPAAGAKAAEASGSKASSASSSAQDPRIRRVEYAPDAVVVVHTKRGQVTHIVLAADEQLVGEHATGQGSSCETPIDTWCVAVGETRRDIFVKPREGATTNNLSLVTTKRRHTFELVAQERGITAMRVVMTLPAPAAPQARSQVAVPIRPPEMSAERLVANRMQAVPVVRNADYSVAVGQLGEEIVPTMVYDDGRSTYFLWPGNRPLPAVFANAADGSEETVNVRMGEDGLLVADRVVRRFVLRLGEAVAAVVNEAFDPEGAAAKGATAVPGVARAVIGRAEVAAGSDGVNR
ncbi:TrbG/VirB9 family P-type conjugative transfer protein [Aquincola sp. S2]|uniref:TrbG/VirB9 family P-type conjugative transfer protein n=1 Tax=Pseudaquabacterium terrae TaxID=2732868 RepID=A0ABX2ERW2_9BURK|nr:TrbG/VirB9 family P-type conjugative transfer protein [Aquabacterium terrae]NRF71373.1 TrbG/VirB9 family P-type conjugative transfer protein [Aquabacterium terrae]